MSPKQALKYLFQFIYILGIIPATYCEEQHKLIVTKKHEKYMLYVTVTVLVIVESLLITFCILSFTNAFNIVDTSKTGNSLIFIQIFECAVIQLILSIMFYVFRYKNVEIFQRILKYGANILCKKHNKLIFKRIFIQCLLNLTLYILFIGNFAVIWITSSHVEWSLYICNGVIVIIFFLYSTAYLTCFTCLIFVIVEWLRILNENLQSVKSTLELNRLLTIRNDLLNLCHKELKLVYGLPIILQSGFTLTSISAFFFLTTVAYEWLNQKFIVVLSLITQSSLHSLPPLIIYIKALFANDIESEANKTAQILARIPRTHTSLDKMIDKFLLKNLRQKPILTAYGFFSLDKSTLFKLFTAIFTYMVILVQFKEMENTTKLSKH